MSRLSFALSTHLYHDERLCRDHLVEVAAHGFDAIELFANAPHFVIGDAAAVGGMRDALSDTGLRVHSVHAPIAETLAGGQWTRPFSLASAHEPSRAQAVAEVLKALDLAQQLRARYLVVHVGVPDPQTRSADDNHREAAARSLEELRAAAARGNVGLALEVMPNSLSGAETLATWLEEDVDLADVGICFDLGHAHLMEDVVDAIEAASGHIVTTHVHDNDGSADTHLLPFEGTLPWDAALMALQKVGYEGAFVLELAGSATPRRVLERAGRVRTRLESLLQGDWGQTPV